MKNLVCIVAVLLVVASASAAEIVREESLPPQGSGITTLAVDIWTFYCPAGGSATVRADTLPSAGGITTSPLDLAFTVYFDHFPTWVVQADDNFTCTVPSDCSYSCPAATFNCGGEGEHTIMVRTIPSALVGCGSREGGYRLGVEVFDNLNGTGTALPESVVRLGGEEPRRGYAWGYLPAGPAGDDVHTDLVTVSPSGAEGQELEMSFEGGTPPELKKYRD
jgi:hypothetical protein